MRFQPLNFRCQGAALIVVLAMIVIMTGLVVTVFLTVSGENKSSAVKLQGESSAQLASSAPQVVMAQIRKVTVSGDAWASQPGMLRTFSTNGTASGVYKLYSALRVFAAGSAFTEDEDTPPADWNVGNNSAIFADINRPVVTSTNGLIYPVADPSVAATNFGAAGLVPGFQRQAGSTPGFDPGTAASASNNPMPMPVRWIYVLKDGQMAIPESVDSNGVVAFSSSAPQPGTTNPVVGRLAYWTDDETCKVNVNTAGYARNTNSYWTFWDTPIAFSSDEVSRLSWQQPWTGEYQRYPGHPATTGLNVVFDSLGLSDSQILTLTPRFRAGGTLGGALNRKTNPSMAEITALRKNERLFASIDELFYDPLRGANAAGISKADLEARRFLLTSSSRAPETTLWNTPRVTIWPTFQTASKRGPTDKLIAFTSTIAGQTNAALTNAAQPFFFVRENPLSTNELQGIPQNLALWNYLRTLSTRDVPGFGGNFQSKYGSDTRDQILTSFFDAIRLSNLDDRSGPEAGATNGWSYTGGRMSLSAGRWTPVSTSFTQGYVAPTLGPTNSLGNATRGAGRAPTLAEVALLFARSSIKSIPVDSPDPRFIADTNGVRPIDRVKVAMLYGLFTPSAGLVNPGQNRRTVVSGLSSFTVKVVGSTNPPQQLFAADTFTARQADLVGRGLNRRMGGRIEWSAGRATPWGPPFNWPPFNYAIPPTGDVVLPYDPANPDANPIEFSGGTITISIFTPEDPTPATTPFHVYSITFPPCQALTPMEIAANRKPSGIYEQQWILNDGRWRNDIGEDRISYLGDTVLAMQSPTGDFRSEVLRPSSTNKPITDFQPHQRYGATNLLTGLTNPLISDLTLIRQLSRRASSMRVLNDLTPTTSTDLNDVLFGRLVAGFNGYRYPLNPYIPSRSGITSIQDTFPPGDFSNGPGSVTEGSLSPKSDEGIPPEFIDMSGATAKENINMSPYFRTLNQGWDVGAGTLASPNRQIPSAVYFGSVPSGAPWRTLLFRPARAYHMGGTSHFGASSPPDYFMLDWFHMPVVEPYAISEPFSTAGKINLNSRLMPFGNYIRRETAMHALLQSARITVMPERLVGERGYADLSFSSDYSLSKDTNAPTYTTRFPVNTVETLDLIRARAEGTDGSNKRVYLSDAEICSVDLVPEGFLKGNLASFWADKRTTGDNSREAPYSSLVPRLTAKSNTFTVHVTAQALKTIQINGGWREGYGKITSEWRGSFPIERYIDPNDSRFNPASPDYAGAAAINFLSGQISVEPFYKFRILDQRRFDP